MNTQLNDCILQVWLPCMVDVDTVLLCYCMSTDCESYKLLQFAFDSNLLSKPVLRFFYNLYFIQVFLVNERGEFGHYEAVHDIYGIAALEIQLPGNEVIIPDIPNMRTSAVSALIYFNRGCYKFPPERILTVLISHIIIADVLGCSQFLEYVGRKLCIPISRFDTSNNYEVVKKVARDRLTHVTQLRFSPSEICYKSKESLNIPSLRTSVVMCRRMEYRNKCISECTKCLYCHETWIGLKCCMLYLWGDLHL